MNLIGADPKKLERLGRYLSSFNLEILHTPTKLNDDMNISKLTIGNKTTPISFEVSNRPNISEFVKECFDGTKGIPTQFELDFVHEQIRESKNLFYKKRILKL
jgi:hypothetical protein